MNLRKTASISKKKKAELRATIEMHPDLRNELLKQDPRSTYKWHDADGETADELYPYMTIEKLSVVDKEEWIKRLHAEDDAEVYNNIKNSRPREQDWQKPGNDYWEEKHPGEKLPKNWNLSLDGLNQTEDVDSSDVMRVLVDVISTTRDPYKELLYDVVASLPEDEQRLFVRRYILDMSERKIATLIGITQPGAHKRIKTLEAKLIITCRKEIEYYF